MAPHSGDSQAPGLTPSCLDGEQKKTRYSIFLLRKKRNEKNSDRAETDKDKVKGHGSADLKLLLGHAASSSICTHCGPESTKRDVGMAERERERGQGAGKGVYVRACVRACRCGDGDNNGGHGRV